MDGVHDLGGMQGFGPATWPGAEEPTHADWERRAFVLALATGPYSAHGFRHTIERIGPARYLEESYYGKWLFEAELALVETGAITHAEVDAMAARLAAGETPQRTDDPVAAAKLVRALQRRRPLRPPVAPRFAVGDSVRVRRMRPFWHTRCPRYLRGAAGVIAIVHGDDGVPDVDNAVTETVYAVRFAARDLWGADVGDHLVHADLWQRYLEPV